jgi:foldase protein PrsA
MIKTESSELAEEIIEKINTGQLDFSVAAADYSTDEQSKDRGGNIGNRKLARFQKSWQPVISALEVGKVSGPHKIGDEYYIFELTHKTEPVQQSFEDRKAFIKNDLLSQKYKAAWQDLYAQLKKQYKVEINQENLDAFIEERSK